MHLVMLQINGIDHENHGISEGLMKSEKKSTTQLYLTHFKYFPETVVL